MDRDSEVLVRRPCRKCGGAGTRRIERGSGAARWSKQVDCETCQGKGKISRWVSIAELQDLVAGDGGS